MIATLIPIKYIVVFEIKRDLKYVLRSLALINKVKDKKHRRNHRIKKRLHKAKPGIVFQQNINFILSWFAFETLIKIIFSFLLMVGIIFTFRTLDYKINQQTQIKIKDYLENSLLAKVLDKVEAISILLALGYFIVNIESQQTRSNYEAWQVINSAEGQGGNGGRVRALEDLNKDEEALAGLTANNADLTGVQLPWADLARARLKNTILNESDLRNADLTNADLCGAELVDANLTEANLSGANLSDSDVTQAKFIEAKLIGTKLCRAKLVEADFSDADLSDADLTNANLKRANFENAILSRTNFQDVVINNTLFAGAYLNSVNLSGFKLNSLDFNSCQLIGAWLENVELVGANLSGVNLSGANLKNADLSNADLQNADLSGTDLDNTNLLGIKNILPEQIKKAKNWEKAKYDKSLAISLDLSQ